MHIPLLRSLQFKQSILLNVGYLLLQHYKSPLKKTTSIKQLQQQRQPMDSSSESDGEPDFTLIHKAAHFLKKDLDGLISRFVARHTKNNTSNVNANANNQEHSLSDTLLHNDFVDQFEAMLEKYVQDECPRLEKMQALQLFFEGAKDTMEGRFMPLFSEEEDPNRDFVESLLAVSDYEVFFKLLNAASEKDGDAGGKSNDVDNNVGQKSDEGAAQKRK